MKHLGMVFATVVTPFSKCVSAFALTSPSKLASRSRPLIIQLNVAIDVGEEAPRDIASFEEWASYGGIQRTDGFQLVGDNLDMSAMTTQDIPAGSPVVYTPNEMIMSSNKVVEEFGRLEEAEDILRTNGYENDIRQYYLMLKILVELEKGQDSPWFPYLNSLPRYFSNGASMTLFCYTCLSPYVELLCKGERVRLNNLSLKRSVPFLDDDVKRDRNLVKWAYQVVCTRGFEANNGSGDFCIAPMADMFNHGSDHEVELVFDESGNCYAQTTRDVPANSPLRMMYGDPTNPSFLLARYGFLDESSPASFCKILPHHVSDEMKNLGYAHNKMLFYKDTGDVSEEVWDVLLYMLLGETDQATQQQFYLAHMAGDHTTKQSIHEQYYPITATKLLDHIDTFLDDLNQLEEKVKYGGKVAADDHPRLPLILRHNEFVRSTFLSVRCKQGLDQNDYG